MRSSFWLIVLFIIYISGFFAHALYLYKTVYGDGVFYFSWLHSIVINRNIDFHNEYEFFHMTQPTTRSGVLGNKYSIGPSLFWLPAYIATYKFFGGTGYEFPYQIAVGLTNVFAALVGLLLLYRLLKKQFDEDISIMTIITIALATNLFFYGSVDAVNSHALSFFAVIIFLSLFLQQKKQWFVIGISLGLVGHIRMQDLLYAIILVPYAFNKNIWKTLLGFLLAFSPQLLAWQILYGKFWMSPYLLHEGFSFLTPHILEVLFSPNNGLFLWTPILLMATIGLFISKRNFWNTWGFLIIALETYLISSWSTWWQGASYSGRMFVSTLPIFSFGLGNVYTSLKIRVKSWFPMTVSSIFSAINCIVIIYFLITH